MPHSVVNDGQFEETAYSCTDIEQMFAMMGLTRFGEQSYLPAGVSGSFEGASRRNALRPAPLAIEDDGTVVVLRNATNGSRNGVYYSYFSTTETGDLQTYLPTNTRYAPKFLPNYTPVAVSRGNDGIFLGTAMNSAGTSALFIALTSGTMNQDLHVGCILGTWNPQDMRYITPVLAGNTVYLIVQNNTTGLSFTVWSLSVADIRANESVTPVQVTGWTTQRPWSTAVSNSDTIMFATDSTSLNNPGKDSYLSSPGLNIILDSVWQSGFQLAGAYDGTSKIRVLVGSEHYVQSSNAGAPRSYWRLSFVMDLNTKQVVPDTGVTLPLRPTAASNPVSFPAPMYANRAQFDADINGNNYSSTVVNLIKKRIYSYSTPNEGVTSIGVGTLNGNITTKFDALLYTRSCVQNSRPLAPDAFGSAVGGELRKPQLLPGNKLLTYGLLNPTPGAIAAGWSLSQLGADGFAYSTLAGNLTGFAPTVDRKYVANGNSVAFGISEIAADGTITYSPAQLNSSRYSCPRLLDGNLQSVDGTTVSISPVVYSQIGNALFTASGINGSAGYVLSVFVPQNPNLPAFLHLLVKTNPGNDGWSVFGTCTVNTRSGQITSYSNVVSLSKTQVGPAGQVSALDVANIGCGMTVYEGTDCWFFAVGHQYQVRYEGNAHSIVWRGLVSKANPGVVLDGTVVQALDYPYLNNIDVPYAVPGWGFGHFDGNANFSTLSGTAIVFKPTGKTIAEYNAWVDGAAKILLSQIVASGWIVYFTEKFPLLVNGKSYSLPITNIDLTTVKANPANSTFYAYVQMVDDVPNYVISAVPITETATTFHIGNVVTNATQIETHSIEKTTMFGGKHLSPKARGNSIPTSSGNPAEGSGTYLW